MMNLGMLKDVFPTLSMLPLLEKSRHLPSVAKLLSPSVLPLTRVEILWQLPQVEGRDHSNNNLVKCAIRVITRRGTLHHSWRTWITLTTWPVGYRMLSRIQMRMSLWPSLWGRNMSWHTSVCNFAPPNRTLWPSTNRWITERHGIPSNITHHNVEKYMVDKIELLLRGQTNRRPFVLNRHQAVSHRVDLTLPAVEGLLFQLWKEDHLLMTLTTVQSFRIGWLWRIFESSSTGWLRHSRLLNWTSHR